jgi:hypothetical protein
MHSVREPLEAGGDTQAASRLTTVRFGEHEAVHMRDGNLRSDRGRWFASLADWIAAVRKHEQTPPGPG